ncbi:MAG: Crp/Fnr family transcriptional regulator [Erysipelotrichaceae bacterium]|nr:Crp/Fnr family transcriptional regulator [Erysipelotrichaceae bacterium]
MLPFYFMIFENIDLETKNSILKKISITKEYLRNEIIFNINDLIVSLAFIKRGAVKVVDLNNRLIKQYNQNEIINLPLLFSKSNVYENKYVSLSLTTISFISKADILKLMNENETINENILYLLSDYSNKLNEHVRLLSYKTIRQKFIEFLLLESRRKKASSFFIDYTKSELAIYLNCERHLLSLEIQKLINEGVIANKNKLYTIINFTRLMD